MTRNQKIGAGVGVVLLLVGVGVLVWRRQRSSSPPLAPAGGPDEQFDPESDIDVCVSGSTGPTACGDDDDGIIPEPIRDAWGIVWGAVGGKPPEATPGTPAWSADPPR